MIIGIDRENNECRVFDESRGYIIWRPYAGELLFDNLPEYKNRYPKDFRKLFIVGRSKHRNLYVVCDSLRDEPYYVDFETLNKWKEEYEYIEPSSLPALNCTLPVWQDYNSELKQLAMQTETRCNAFNLPFHDVLYQLVCKYANQDKGLINLYYLQLANMGVPVGFMLRDIAEKDIDLTTATIEDLSELDLTVSDKPLHIQMTGDCVAVSLLHDISYSRPRYTLQCVFSFGKLFDFAFCHKLKYVKTFGQAEYWVMECGNITLRELPKSLPDYKKAYMSGCTFDSDVLYVDKTVRKRGLILKHKQSLTVAYYSNNVDCGLNISDLWCATTAEYPKYIVVDNMTLTSSTFFRYCNNFGIPVLVLEHSKAHKALSAMILNTPNLRVEPVTEQEIDRIYSILNHWGTQRDKEFERPEMIDWYLELSKVQYFKDDPYSYWSNYDDILKLPETSVMRIGLIKHDNDNYTPQKQDSFDLIAVKQCMYAISSDYILSTDINIDGAVPKRLMTQCKRAIEYIRKQNMPVVADYLSKPNILVLRTLAETSCVLWLFGVQEAWSKRVKNIKRICDNISITLKKIYDRLEPEMSAYEKERFTNGFKWLDYNSSAINNPESIHFSMKYLNSFGTPDSAIASACYNLREKAIRIKKFVAPYKCMPVELSWYMKNTVLPLNSLTEKEVDILLQYFGYHFGEIDKVQVNLYGSCMLYKPNPCTFNEYKRTKVLEPMSDELRSYFTSVGDIIWVNFLLETQKHWYYTKFEIEKIHLFISVCIRESNPALFEYLKSNGYFVETISWEINRLDYKSEPFDTSAFRLYYNSGGIFFENGVCERGFDGDVWLEKYPFLKELTAAVFYDKWRYACVVMPFTHIIAAKLRENSQRF